MGRIFFRFPSLGSIIRHLLRLPRFGISFATTSFTLKLRCGSVHKTGQGLVACGFRATGNRLDTAPWMKPITENALSMKGTLYPNANART